MKRKEPRWTEYEEDKILESAGNAAAIVFVAGFLVLLLLFTEVMIYIIVVAGIIALACYLIPGVMVLWSRHKANSQDDNLIKDED